MTTLDRPEVPMKGRFAVLLSISRRCTIPRFTGVFAPTLLLTLLLGCATSFSWSRSARATSLLSGSLLSGAGNMSVASGSGSVSLVSCSRDSCSVTLGGSDSRAHVLATTIGLRCIDGDQVTLRVEDQDVTCTQGQSLPVGSLLLTCTAVTDDTVTFTVARG
jgi:hypothetical protein